MVPPVFYLESFAELVYADLLRKLIELVTACSFLPFSLHRAHTASSVLVIRTLLTVAVQRDFFFILFESCLLKRSLPPPQSH